VKGGRRHDTIVRQAAAEQGQAAAEYAALLAFVAGVLIVAYQLFGEQVAALYDHVLAAFT
jgi:Flp pilus assembly pilin Flp